MKKSQAVLGAVLIGGLLGLLPGEASASGIELKLGAFFPRADSILFKDDMALYWVEKSDFVGVFGGIEFTKSVSPNIELALSVEGYGREIDTSYRDFTRPSGHEIQQTLKFETVPTSGIVRFMPAGKYRKLTPYVGGGASAVWWSYEEWGDFIDFDDPGRRVIFDSFKSTGTAFAMVANGGLRYRLNTDMQVTADVRYFFGEDKMGGDFYPNKIDISGPAVTLGFRMSF